MIKEQKTSIIYPIIGVLICLITMCNIPKMKKELNNRYKIEKRN